MTPTNDSEFLEALLDAEIDPCDVLTIINEWVNGSRSDAVKMLKPHRVLP